MLLAHHPAQTRLLTPPFANTHFPKTIRLTEASRSLWKTWSLIQRVPYNVDNAWIKLIDDHHDFRAG